MPRFPKVDKRFAMEVLGIVIGILTLGAIGEFVGFDAGFMSWQTLIAGGIIAPFITVFIMTFIAVFLGKGIASYIGLKTA